MNVDFTVEQMEQISRIAAYTNTDPVRLVKNAALRLVEDEARFRAAVRQGVAEADRGELIDHADVVARIESRFSRPR